MWMKWNFGLEIVQNDIKGDQSFYQSYQTYTKPTKTIRFGMHSPFTKPYTIQGLYSIVLLPNLTQFCDCTMESLPNLSDAAQTANGTRNGH